MSTDAVRTAEQDAPTTELVTAAVGDRCANCQAPLAPDQRYCVNCGARRGRARFAPETVAYEAPVTAAVMGPPRQPRWSSGATLVAGVATLLIALGVGVLIGHYSANTTSRNQAAQVITVPAGGGSAAATTNSAATPTTSGSRATSGKKAKTTVVHVNAKVAKAANQAAAKVLGSSGNLSKNVTQTVGGSCSGGKGCQGGKFTGNFFGGN